MTIVKGTHSIKKYYQKDEVVNFYLKKRFVMPLRQLHHDTQVNVINSIINNLKPNSRILEIALGPARLTTKINIKNNNLRCGIDYSWQMLTHAKKNLIENNVIKSWNLMNSDAFNLPFKENSFDLIYTFRLIRHFELEDRKKIYTEINRVMKKENSLLIFDAQNYNVSYPHRVKEGLDSYAVYDKLYKKNELISELENQGWKVELRGVMCNFNLQELLQKFLLKFHLSQKIIKRFLRLFENGNDTNPSEWIVLCEKK